MQVYISNKEIEQIAEGLVQVSCGEPPPKYIDIDSIAAYLGITVVYEQIAENDPDKIGFASDGVRPLMVWRNGRKASVIFPKDTVVLETLLLNPSEKTRRRFVLAHEISHILIWRADPLRAAACFNSVYDTERTYSMDELHERLSLEECQAKVVHMIPAKIDLQEEVKHAHKQFRVAAYCRVSTKQEDQLNSYDVQRRAYTDKINGEPGWTMVGIYADKGITGTSIKKRDDFNKLMRHCKQGKVDMIITKSVARFARNTLDCLKHTRMLKEYNVDVYFEEQGIHSIQPGSEFYITIYGSIAQSESENISANVRWGKAQSAKEGNVPFQYKRFLGYRRGSDGKPEIDPEQAVVVKRIYERFLAGDSLATIANDLNADGIPTPSGTGQWQRGTIESILTNEKYKGDAILNKTYIRDCLSKKVMINNGERPKYYVENNHPAIIDSATFGRVQEEMARRCGKRKVKQVGTKTEQGRYSSKYALTELLICGECGTPYRRCTWAVNGKKKVVWRCINRLDYGKKYCHDSPSIEESVLQEAIMKAVLQTAKQNAEVLKMLKLHIGMGLSAETNEDNSLDLQIRIAEIEAEFQKMLKAIAADNVETFDEEKAKALMDEKAKLQIQLDRIADTKQKRENAKSRLDEIFMIIEALANHPISYDDQIVRQILESVIVESKEKIKVVFVGGLEVTQNM